jgi:hypothetical protein
VTPLRDRYDEEVSEQSHRRPLRADSKVNVAVERKEKGSSGARGGTYDGRERLRVHGRSAGRI